MRVGPHSHPCSICRASTECCGSLVENHDGEPWVICEDYHQPGGTVAEVVCEACEQGSTRHE